MPNSRIVTATLHHPDDTPWVGGVVTYTLRVDSFTAGATFPKDVITATADGDGVASATLWTNAEGVRPSHYSYTLPDGSAGDFVLPAGSTPIALESIRALDAIGPWTELTLAGLTEILRADIFSALANTSHLSFGDALIGYKAVGGTLGRTLHAKMGELVSLVDFGAVADNSTDLAAAITAALAVVPAGTTLWLPSSATPYVWTATVLWNKADVTLDARGASIRFSDSVGKITVLASGGTVLGGSWSHTPAAGTQGSGSLIRSKSIANGDAVGDYTDWTLAGCRFQNITVRFQKINRINVRIPLHYSTFAVAMTPADTVLTVRNASLLVGAQYARVLTETGEIQVRAITDIDTALNTVTIATPFSNAAPIGRRCTGVTLTTAAYTTGATVIAVEDTTIFTLDMYVYLVKTTGVVHISQVTEIISATQIRLGTALVGDVASGGTVIPMNDGTFPVGTDVSSGIRILSCEFKHSRVNHTLELGGIVDALVYDCAFHDLFRYPDPDDARYFTEVSSLTADVDTNYGEGIKVTAGSYRVWIDHCTFTRIARNALDFFSGGGGWITNNQFYDLNEAAIELKFSLHDVLDPKAVIVSQNTFTDIRSWAMLAGAPGSIIDSNIFEQCEAGGIYVNGANSAAATTNDEDEDEYSGYAENIVVSNNVVAYDGANTATGIIVTEAAGITISGNVCTGNFYNIQLATKSTRCVVVGNICRQHRVTDAEGQPVTGQDIRVVGHESVDSLHIISGNITDTMTGAVQLFDSLAQFTLINGHGAEAALAGGASPTLTKWPIGALVKNATDGKIWLRGLTAWTVMN